MMIVNQSEIPADLTVDHIDGDPGNNSLSNLRIATTSENLRNRKTARNNQCGLKGVQRKGNGWAARINQKHIGFFKTKEEAHAAYCDSARREFGEFARAA